MNLLEVDRERPPWAKAPGFKWVAFGPAEAVPLLQGHLRFCDTYGTTEVVLAE